MTCRTCAHYDLAKTLDKAGRVRSDRAARCLWTNTEPLPISLTRSWHMARLTPHSHMRPNDGQDCPAHKPREAKP